MFQLLLDFDGNLNILNKFLDVDTKKRYRQSFKDN